MPGGEIVTNFVEAKGMHPTNATFTFPVLATTDGSPAALSPALARGPEVQTVAGSQTGPAHAQAW